MNPNILNFMLAVILGIAMGLAFTVGLYEAIQPLKQWQALIAGGFATVVGLVTALLIWTQIRIQKTQIDNLQKSRALGATALLPDALSALTNYVRSCVSYFHDQHSQVMTAVPNPPTTAMEAIKRSVEHVDPQSAKQLYDLIVHYQIFNSRLPDFGPNGTFTDGQDFYDATLLQAHINRAFKFARNQQPKIPSGEITKEEMLNALRNSVGLGTFLDHQGELAPTLDWIDRQHPDSG